MWIVFVLAALFAPFAVALTIDIGYATYESNVSLAAGVTSFLGIRYASPPVGELRWQPPQPPVNMTGTQSAIDLPYACIQGPGGLSSGNPFEQRSLSRRFIGDSEDCLFLNVHVPSNVTDNASLPVIFWIHGGGYVWGNGSDPAQDFVKESGYQVISVNAQYRLGLFGFLPGQDIKDGGALNAGLLDQEFALQWVQNHISAFGGDPTRVTIWGESAGAGSVLQHVVAHRGNTQPPLFRAAIMSSCFLPFQYNFNDDIPESLYSEVAKQSNCIGSDNTLECLRATDVDVLANINNVLGAADFYGTYLWVPVVDGSFIVERPSVTLEAGRVNGEALLAVTNSFEGNIFVNTTMFENSTYSLTDYVSALFVRMDESQINHTVDMYTEEAGLPDTLSQAEAVMGESIFICPTYYALDAFGSSSWKGEFAVPPALHASDMLYYFLSAAAEQPHSNASFSDAFSRAFIGFAEKVNETFESNSSTLTPTWPTWSEGHAEMLFNLTALNETVVHTITTDHDLLARCKWWRDMASVNGQ